jgi:hypothetical protein
MKSFRWNNLRQLVAIAAVTMLLLPFQNCSVPGRSSSSNLKDQQSLGGGTDGKASRIYVSYGLCDDSVRVRGSISMADDFKSARVLVADCEPLANPAVLNGSDFRFLTSDNSLLTYQGQIFDRQLIVGEQKVTLQVCQVSDPALQTRVWATLTQPSQYLAQIISGGQESGNILLKKPTASEPTHYLSETGQASSFDLNVSGVTASLTYSFNGHVSETRNGLACLAQATPPTDDGSAHAPAGPSQHASLLSGYAIRPMWKVAGVDYAVGFPSGMSLKNPASISNPGVSVDNTNHLIRVVRDGVTLDGYDFSMGGGYGVYIVGAKNTTIVNSNFVGSGISADANSSGLTIRNCVLDGTGDPDSYGMVSMLGAGELNVQYSWFKNFTRAIVDERSPSVVLQYNLFEDGGSVDGKGFSYLYFTGVATYAPIKVLFNTVTQAHYAGSAQSIGFVLDGMNGSAVTAEFGYNTLVTAPNSIGTLIQASTPGTIAAAILHDNFIDGRGATQIFGADPTAGDSNFYLNNFDLNSGDFLAPP